MKQLLIAAAATLIATHAVAQNQAVLSWSAPTTYVDGTPITATVSYNVYQALQGQPKIIVGALTTTNNTATVTSGLSSGATYCWEVTAFIGANESARSAQACKTFAPSLISIPVLTVQ